MLLMGTSKQDMTRIYFLLGVIAVTVCSAMLLDGDTAVQTTGRVQGMCRDDTATNCSSFTSAACLQFKENTARLCPKTCGFCHCYDTDEHCQQFAANCDRFDMLKGGACNLTCGQCVDDYNPEVFLMSLLPDLITKPCSKFGIILETARGIPVTHPDAHVCPTNNARASSEAVLYQLCNAPNLQTWTYGEKVLNNCHRVPAYSAIVGESYYGDISAVFLKCEPGGFQIATQKCGLPLQIVHVNMTDSDFLRADKYFVLHWQ